MQRACILVGLVLGANGARAQTLTWDVPAECPPADRLVVETERLLNHPLPADGLRVEARVRRAAGILQLRLELELEGASEDRILESRDCLALVRAAALMIATRIDPDAVRRALEGVAPASGPVVQDRNDSTTVSPGSETPPLPAAAERETPPARRQSEGPVARASDALTRPNPAETQPALAGEQESAIDSPPQARATDDADGSQEQVQQDQEEATPVSDSASPIGPRLSLGAFALFDVGAMPSVTVGPGGRLRYGGRFDVALDVAGFFSQRRNVTGGFGGDIVGVGAQLTLTWNAMFRSWIRLGPALGIDGLLYLGRGVGVSNPSSATAPMLRAHLGARTELRLVRRLLLTFDVSVHAAVFRPEFQLDDIGIVFAPPPFGFRAQLGLAVVLFRP